MSESYLSTLGAILGKLSDADHRRSSCLIAQRDRHLGTAKTIRNIQAQMLSARVLAKETRSQGHGFVGEVFVYAPQPHGRHRKTTPDDLERMYRRYEGEHFYPTISSNINPQDIPY